MHLTVSHQLPKDEAKTRIDRFLEHLQNNPPAQGLTLTAPQKQWEQDRCTLAFTLGKSFIKANFTGHFDVAATAVDLELTIPGALTMFVSETTVRDRLHAELTQLLRP